MKAHFVFEPLAGQSTAFSVTSDRKPHGIRSDAEAIGCVRDLAASFRLDARWHGLARALPCCAIRSLALDGFFGITVPKTFGGAGVSAATMVESLRILSACDAGIGRMLQDHFCWLPTVTNGTSEQAAFFFSRFLAGDRIGHVHPGDPDMLSETPQVIRRTRGGWLVTGRKYYSPGAASAQWLAFAAHFDVAGQRSSFVFIAAAAADGITPAGREVARGHGAVIFDDVFIPDSNVFPLLASAADRSFQINASLIHAAIALGIAEDALSDAGAYIRNLDLRRTGVPDEENAVQPIIFAEFEKFSAVVRMAGILLHDAAQTVDQALAWPSKGTVLSARLAVADARLVCSDVANRIADEFFLLADVCAALGKYGFDRHRRKCTRTFPARSAAVAGAPSRERLAERLRPTGRSLNLL
jgi:alkylation response protein AidB-like acyl-CoA dehydrogenase